MTIRIKDLVDPTNYLFIKICLALQEKFKPGDYVKVNFHNEGKWVPYKDRIVRFRSSYREVLDEFVEISPIFLVKEVQLGAINASMIEYDADSRAAKVTHNQAENLITDYESLFTTIRYALDEGDIKISEDADVVVNDFVTNMVTLDPDFADSVIMDTQYIPYESQMEDINKNISEALKRFKENEKYIRSNAALEGWETRRRNIHKKQQEQRAAAAQKKKASKKKTKKR